MLNWGCVAAGTQHGLLWLRFTGAFLNIEHRTLNIQHRIGVPLSGGPEGCSGRLAGRDFESGVAQFRIEERMARRLSDVLMLVTKIRINSSVSASRLFICSALSINGMR